MYNYFFLTTVLVIYMRFNAEKCGYCGACVSVCPHNSLELAENNIVVNKNKCDDCGICTFVCPLGAFYPEGN